MSEHVAENLRKAKAVIHRIGWLLELAIAAALLWLVAQAFMMEYTGECALKSLEDFRDGQRYLILFGAVGAAGWLLAFWRGRKQ